MVTYRPAILGLIFLTLSLTCSSVLAQDEHTIFFDNFEDGDLVGWDISFAGDDVDVINLDGNNVLHITGEQNDFVSLGFSDDLNGAAVIETRIQIIDLGPNNGSVVLNLMSENPGHASGYSALISSGGASLLNRNDNFTDIEPVTQQDFQINLGQWYLVRFEASSSTLNLWVDGVSVKLASVAVIETGEPVFIFDRGMEVYLDDVRIEHPDYVAPATETPQIVAATAEPVPTRHPQDLPNDRLVPVDVVLATAPRSYRWELTDGRFVFDTRTIRIRPENLGTIVDIYGNPIQHGVYSPDTPPPILPQLLPQPVEINGRMAEYGYVVGTVAFGVRDPGTQFEAMFASVTFFAEGSNEQVDVIFEANDLLSRAGIGVQGSNGLEISTPSNQRGEIAVGTNLNSNIVINPDNRTISIPTVNDPVTIQEGDEVMIAILWNQEISNYARTWGDQLPSRWSQTVFDSNTRNDPQQIIIEPMGLIISNREATSLSSAQTVESSPTPTPQEVAVLPSTSIDLPNDMLRPVDVVIDTAPRSYTWRLETGGFLRDTRTVVINPENLGTLVDIYGNPLQHGVYTPDNPPPVRPELLPQPLEINGRMAEYGYVVGTFSMGVSRVRNLVENTEQVRGQGAITFFAEGTNEQIDIFFPLDNLWNNASIGVQAGNGSEVGTPADDRGRIPLGNNESRNLVIDFDNRTITIPTDNGPVVIHEGDEIMIAILWNQEISNYARTWGDQMPSRWSQTMFDNNPNNDAQEIFVEPMGIIISDRSTRSGE